MTSPTQVALLKTIAKQAMLDKGMQADFPQGVLEEAKSIQNPARSSEKLKDYKPLLWCSIDNDDSRDLDQLTYAEEMEDGNVKIFIAVADVDALVPKGSAIDINAAQNTTSVYTPARIFTMLPENLCYNLSSLNEDQDRVAVVTEIIVDESGNIINSHIEKGVVKNKAKLAYSKVGAWLADGPIPEKIKEVNGLDKILKLQDHVAQVLRKKRKQEGSLALITIEPKAVLSDDRIVGLEISKKNRAHELIEEFMVAANQVAAMYLTAHDCPSLRRVVRVPERWDRIVSLAQEQGEALPSEPDSIALNAFLLKMRQKDPARFPDLSLSVIKLLGRGEYVVERKGEESLGHFGLALQDYTHSTAPNRRYPDVITQRILKCSLLGQECCYSPGELAKLAAHCSVKEDAANKVERRVRKSAAAMLLEKEIGKVYKGIITGASAKGTWVRVFDPPVEGKIVAGTFNVDVGDRVNVKLIQVDIPMGYIDFSFVEKLT